MLIILDTLFGVLMVAAAASDIRRYRIPNWISLWLVALFAVRAGIAPDGLWWHLGLGFVVLAAGFGLFTANLFGAGDAKLLAVVSLWTGPALLIEQLVVTALAGGVLAASILLRRLTQARIAPVNLPSGDHETTTLASTPLPYGVAIAAGGLWCVARHHFGA